MIDEYIEYKELLVDRISKGNYYSLTKGNNETYPFKIKGNDKRVYPPLSSFLIIRYFLFKDINDWSSLSLEERKQRIEVAKIAYLCWLGDKDSYEEGKLLLKEEFATLVTNDVGAYELFCNKCPNANKLRLNREYVITKLKSGKDFYDKKSVNKYEYDVFKFHTIIPNCIALGPLKSNIIAFKKSEVNEMYQLLNTYKFVGGKAFNTIKEGYWALILLLSCYLKIYQLNHLKGNIDAYVDISLTELITLLNKDEKIVKLNGTDIRYNMRFAASSITKIIDREAEENICVDYAFDFIGNDIVFNNLWRPKAKVTKYIYVFNDINDIDNIDDYIVFKGLKGPDYKDAFIEQLFYYID